MNPLKPMPPELTRKIFSGLAVCLLAGLPSQASAQVSGLNAPQAVGAFFNNVFPTTAPGSASGWTTENAFPNLTFIDPLWLDQIPGTGNLLLVGKDGQLWRFANDPAVTQAQVVSVLDWRGNTQTSEDQGFYSLVFHPEFGQAGSANANYVYACYSGKPALAGADENHSYWRVSRFTWLPASGTLDPASEFVLISQYDRCRWHNGGAMFFDNDGFLNITDGDGGDSTEGGGLTGADGALSRTQKLTFGLFSGVFRIDVNNDPAKSHAIRRQPQSPTNKPTGWPASFTQGYGIPNDNPWLDAGGAILEEFHSLGLRSPHTAHYDAVNGEVWIGDVGEGSREEVTRLPKGGNAQWGYREGSITGPGSAAVPPIGAETPPVIDYNRTTGSCIIGGMRYRGAKWNALLGGKVLYGDHAMGRIWTATLDAAGGSPVIERIVDGFPTGAKTGLANFCTDSAGEIYLMNVNGTNMPGGTIRKLATAGISTEPPQLLSQTGIFSNLATLATAPGVIPYHIANPLWSDAAAKMRWLILPNDGSHNTAAEDIVFDEEGSWLFPAGTVLVKHFEMATDANDPSQVKRLETRFLVCTAGGGKYGFTYRWNAAGTDAELLTTGQQEDFPVTLQNGSTSTRRWDYPSRGDCMQCHTATSGQALGLRTASLNESFHYDSTGRTANQLATYNALGMFDRTLTVTELENFTEARGLGDATAPIEHRVRSYLDMNCSHCHRPGSTIDYFDARLGTPLNTQGMINGVLKGHYDLGVNGRYLKPGDPDLSAIHVRLSNVGNGAAMPPLAKNLVDQQAVDVLREYLLGLSEAEFQTTPSPQAQYVRLTATSEVAGNPWTSVGDFSVLDGNGAAIPTSALSVFAVDSEELVDEFAPATNAIDGDPDTIWHTAWGADQAPMPHFITIDLGSLRSVGGFVYTPRQTYQNGRIANYQVHYSTDGVSWTLVTSGTWGNDDVVKRYDGLAGQRKTRCQIAGPTGTVNGPFDVTVVFDMDVTGFTASDLQVSGGTVTKLRGSGYYYVATITPGSGNITVAVAQDAVSGVGQGSRAAGPLSLAYLPAVPEITLVWPAVATVRIASGSGLVLEALVADDGLPSPLATTWTMVSGPGVVTFGSANQPNTTARFSADGAYLLRLTANDGLNAVTKDVTVTVGGAAGGVLTGTTYGGGAAGSFTKISDTSYTLSGASSGIDSGGTADGFYLLGQNFTGDFDLKVRVPSGSNVSNTATERVGLIVRQGSAGGAGEVSGFVGFDTTPGEWGYWIRRGTAGGGNTNTNLTAAVYNLPGWCRLTRVGDTVSAYFSEDGGSWGAAAGTMTVTGTARAGLCWSSDNTTSTGTATFDGLSGFQTDNRGPLVDAGVDQSITYGASATLSGTSSDDGLPGPVTTLWSQVSGAGTASFTNAAALSTSAAFTAAGSHTLRLTAADGEVKTFDELAVTISSPIETWRLAQFGASVGDALIAGDLADPDHDGLANLIEYALGTNPNAGGPSGIVVDFETLGGEGYLRVSVTKNPAAVDVTFAAEVTGDLGDPAAWKTSETIVETNTASSFVARDSVPMDSAERRFIRLRITR